MNIRLDSKGECEVALEVKQRYSRINRIDLPTLQRQVHDYDEQIRQFNLPNSAKDEAELLVSAIPANQETGKQPQTTVNLKYDASTFMWYIKGIYRTSELLPENRIKMHSVEPDQAARALNGIMKANGVDLDSVTCFYMF